MTAFDARGLPRYGNWSSRIFSMDMFGSMASVLQFGGGWWSICVFFFYIDGQAKLFVCLGKGSQVVLKVLF